MKTSMKLVLLTAMIFGSGCSHAKNGSESTNIMMDMKNAKDWCAGRYTIKIPNTAQPFAGGDKYNSFIIESRVGANVNDLNNTYESIRKRYLLDIVSIAVEGPVKKIGSKTVRILAGKAGTIKGAPSDLYAFILDRNVLFELNIPYMPEKKDLVFNELNYIIENIRARTKNSVPTQKGVCISNGFIKDDGSTFRRSLHTIAFLDKAHPSVRISLEVEAMAKKEVDLITRMESKIKQSGFAHQVANFTKTIRKGKKSQSGGAQLLGYEWISTVPMEGQEGVFATWEHTGTSLNANDPTVNFEFDSGYEVIMLRLQALNVKTSSINEKASVQAYEQILNTIRKF